MTLGDLGPRGDIPHVLSLILKKYVVQLLSCVRLFAIPWTALIRIIHYLSKLITSELAVW